MEDVEMTLGYAEWIITWGLTLGLFNYFSKKYERLLPLAAFVLVPTWIISAIFKGITYIYLYQNYELFTIRGFLMLLTESLLVLIVFGGLTFAYKFVKFKKKKENI